MRQCPQCKTTYTDDSLSYCLSDGAVLDDIRTGEATQVLNAGSDQVRIDIPETVTIPARRPSAVPKGNTFKWIVGILAAASLLLVLLAAAGTAFYFGTRPVSVPIANSATPTPTATAKIEKVEEIDEEKERLRKELADLQKKLDERKSTEWSPNEIPDGSARAKVNSPGDGFLAMRSEPSANYGERLAKIPHNTTVELSNCEKDLVTIGGKKGRWCLVTYGNDAGWVFDAFLVY